MIGLPYRVLNGALIRARVEGSEGEVYAWRGRLFEVIIPVGWYGDMWYAVIRDIGAGGSTVGAPRPIHIRRYSITVDGVDCGLYTGVTPSDALEAYARAGGSTVGATVEEVAS